MKTDAILQDDVLSELKWEPSVVETHIGVTTEDGIVSLYGQVPSYAEKNTAEEAVKRVSGVRAIVNELKVNLPHNYLGSDEDVAAECLRAIESNTTIPNGCVRVVVRDHWVTLEGEVDWQYQIGAALNSVRYLRGISGITNLIKLKAAKSNLDIKQRILDTLHRRSGINTSSIQIEAVKGRVILSGKVHSFAEKENVEMAAWSAPGVAEVDSNLQVAV